MPPANPDRPIKLELEIAANHPSLLDGLETWLKLGLISDRQVRAFCQRSLTCPVPVITLSSPSRQPTRTTVANTNAIPTPSPHRTPTSSPPKPSKPSLVNTTLSRLVAELSVVWLLCLGVFLVVVSSALLAAAQWSIFSPTAQYLVLFAYTGVFWGIGLWASRQSRLALTAKTLQTVSLLLVPINLWAMNGLQIIQANLGLLVAIGATLLLGLASYRNFKFYDDPTRGIAGGFPKLSLLNFLGLAGLHWFWHGETLPLWVVYGGTIATAIALLSQSPLRRQWHSNTPADSPILNGPRLLVLYALGIVMMRGLANPAIEPQALGLAVGICGAMLCALALEAWSPRLKRSSKPRLSQASATNQTTPNPFGEGPLTPNVESRETTEPGDTPPITPTPKPSFTQLWIVIGRGLMVIGWLMAVGTLPVQALGVSLLGLSLRTHRLRRLWLRRDLVVALGLGLQLIWLGWRGLPETMRQPAIALATRLTGTAGMDWVLLGIAYFPYVVAMVAIADWLVRQRKSPLAKLTYGLGLVLGMYLTLISAFDTTVLALNLIASTITLLIVTLRRRQQAAGISALVYSTHGLGLLTIFVAIADAFPTLSIESVLALCFGSTAVELGLSVGPRNPWRRSAWLLGNGLLGLSDLLLLGYGLAQGFEASWMLLGFVPPLVLTLISTRPALQRRQASHTLAVITLLFATLLCLFTPANRLMGLGTATALMGSLSVMRSRRLTAGLTVGLGLGLVASLIHDLPSPISPLTRMQWYLIGAIACGILWLIWHGLRRHRAEDRQSLVSAYQIAVNGWGFSLCFALLIVMSLEAYLHYLDLRAFQPTFAFAAGGLVLAGLIRNGRSLNDSALLAIGWAIELTVAEVLAQQSPDALTLAIANIVLGALSLGLGTLLSRRFRPLPVSLQAWPILYSALALMLRVAQFNSWTGFLTLSAGLIALEVGRQQRQGWLRAIAFIIMSIAWYELVIYQMLQAPEGNPADGWVILAGVAAVIMGAYQLFARLLSSRVGSHLGLPPAEFRWAAHFHWFIGTGLLWQSAFLINDALQTAPLAFAIGVALVVYALAHGRWSNQRGGTAAISAPVATDNGGANSTATNQTSPQSAPRRTIRPGTGEKVAWTWVGISQLLGLAVYARLLFPGLQVLGGWIGVLASVVASLFYYGAWTRWGWPQRPWRQTAIALPITTAIYGLWAGINVVNLWVIAGFYGGLSWRSRRIRLSYLSGLLILIAIYQWLVEQRISDVMAYILPLGLLLLYIAQVDPRFQQRQSSGQRHALRLLGTGLILGIALVSDRWTGIPVGLMSLGAIALGLVMQVRAFLYVGTAILVFNVLNQLVLLNGEYPLTKWVVGMVVGVLLIWIAADFERRREQWSSLAQRWQAALSQWE
ncbi:MAG: hypothetical protein AAF215_29785 [Cyanobacteria bacterium P01_A01_bin.123]